MTPPPQDGFRIISRDGYQEIVGTVAALQILRNTIQTALVEDKASLIGDKAGDAVLIVRVVQEWPEEGCGP